MKAQCISNLEKMGVKSCSMSYKLEHDIILFMSKIGSFEIKQYTENTQLTFTRDNGITDSYIVNQQLKDDLFVHGLVNLCGKLWDYLNEAQRKELQKVLEG